LLLNRTSRGGTDAALFLSWPLSRSWGGTLLAGAHLQDRNDIDSDGWTDMPGYERFVIRPRLFLDNGSGVTSFFTAGFTGESRDGGTVDGGVVPGGTPFVEALATRRFDAGALARFELDRLGASLTLRGSGVNQDHTHDVGTVREDDVHRTWFAEAALSIPRGRATFVAGGAFQGESYRNTQVASFDYRYSIPSAFFQADIDATSWSSMSASARVDAHSDYGTVVNPRVSLLLRNPAGVLSGWSARLSAGSGAFAPTPFTEETEATGLTPLAPLAGLQQERAHTASLDVGGPLQTGVGQLELNATLFASEVEHPLQVRELPGMAPGGASRLMLSNAPAPTRTRGGEILVRFVRELGEPVGSEESPALRITANYTLLRSTECNPDELVEEETTTCVRREVPLTPRHSAGIVSTIEKEGESRIGLELYYTGRQMLDDNPYRSRSRPYLIVGLLGERAFNTAAGVARLFLNLENITNVRQTRHDPLLLPTRGPGGRWATDAWTDLAGFTVNGGIRLGF
jgi:iron complex outermembrane receptor protein